MKYTKMQFVSQLQKQFPNEPFEIINYNGTSKAGTYYCGLCQQTYNIYRMGKLLKYNHLCRQCFASQSATEVLNILSTSETLEFSRFIYNHNLHKPAVEYKCKECGEYTIKPYIEFLKHPTCIHCGFNSKRRTTAGLRQILPDEFEPMEEYKGKNNPILIKHKKCGFIFKVSPDHILTGHSYCPKCSKKASKGERTIMNFLINNNISFEKEKVFNWSDHKRYDFYLPDYNLLIEFQGRQHYIDLGGHFIPLEEQQKIDAFKKNSAINHGYNFLDISYIDINNISSILAQRLSQLGVGNNSETKST